MQLVTTSTAVSMWEKYNFGSKILHTVVMNCEMMAAFHLEAAGHVRG